MLRALDQHFGYQYTNTIRQTIATPYLALADAARHNGKRTETVRHLVTCLRNGGWQLPGRRRTLTSLAAYVFLGSWYRVFWRAKKARSD